MAQKQDKGNQDQDRSGSNQGGQQYGQQEQDEQTNMDISSEGMEESSGLNEQDSSEEEGQVGGNQP